jgi:hypothetical protein
MAIGYCVPVVVTFTVLLEADKFPAASFAFTEKI